MMPVGPLMIEHRLIERMIALMAREAQRIRQGLEPDTEFIRTAVDFVRMYADRLHHGKEEDILFRDLARKPLPADLKEMMDGLIREHALGRETTRKLVEACDRYLKGEKDAVNTIVEALNTLAGFYPKHIEKEDKYFFLPVMKYFTDEEQASMLAECNEFDRKFIHLAYKKIVAEWEKNDHQ